jgi:hypothetical protein
MSERGKSRAAPVGLSHFNYWSFESINPFAVSVTGNVKMVGPDPHEYLSGEYRQLYEAGDRDAIFLYVGADRWALRERWVIDEIERWRTDGGRESRKFYEKLWKSYWNDRGKRNLSTIIDEVERDQRAYSAIVRRRPVGGEESVEAAVGAVAEEMTIPEESLWEIYKVYRFRFKWLTGRLPIPPGLQKAMEEKGWPPSKWDSAEDEQRKGYSDVQLEESRFSDYLAMCLRNLRHLRDGEPAERWQKGRTGSEP